MSIKTETLTPEQISRMPEFMDKWLGIGLSTAPVDRERGEHGIWAAYQAAGLPPPKIIIWLDSPLALCYGKAMTKMIINAQVGDQVEAQVGSQVGDQVLAQVADQVGDQVLAQVRDQVGDQVRDQVGDQVRDQVGDQIGNLIYGQHESWLSFYDYIETVLEIDC